MNARLTIYIGKKNLPQGKIYKVEGASGRHWYYLADITENKFYRNYQQGLAIADRILKAFDKLKLRVTILYRWKEKGLVYASKKSLFYEKGILRKDGGHHQWILPFKHWRVWKEAVNEKFDLPNKSVDAWLREFGYDHRRVEDFSAPLSVFAKIKEMNPELVEKLRA